MSKTKFTDGPWHKKGRKVFWQKPDRNLPKDNLFNGLVAICASTEDNPPEVIEEANANASLIACSPEMYALLQKIIDNKIIPDYQAHVAQEIIKLLKKARGEE